MDMYTRSFGNRCVYYQFFLKYVTSSAAFVRLLIARDSDKAQIERYSRASAALSHNALDDRVGRGQSWYLCRFSRIVLTI
jgi:hypothetical protein